MITKTLNILFIEDSQEDIDLAQEALKQQGIEATLTILNNGQDGLAYLKKDGKYKTAETPDIIVLDLNLPKINGFKIIEEINTNLTSIRKIPLLVLTTSYLTENTLKDYNIAPQNYIKKSVDFHEFANIIKTFYEPPEQKLRPSKPVNDQLIRNLPPVRILLIEDNLYDVELIEEILYFKEKHRWTLRNTSRLNDGLKLLEEEEFDVVALDLYLPDSQGLKTLRTLSQTKPLVPIIIVTGLDDEYVGIEALREGAQDYLVKGQITAETFIRSVRYAMERKNIEMLKDELIGYVNHELTNPLTVINEGVSQIADGLLGPVNEKQKVYLGKILQNIDKLLHITEDMLTSTKLEFGKLKLNKEDFDIVKLAQELIDTQPIVHQKSNIKLYMQNPHESIMVHADKARIEQVLINLLSNAVKFTTNGVVEVFIKPGTDSAQCTVADTGPGIDHKDIPKLFNKFTRFNTAGNSHIKGNGLGLYICKKLVELHGGKIWIKSVLNVGTSISFSIPREDKKPREKE